jgi:sperm-associated antigen 16 protein
MASEDDDGFIYAAVPEVEAEPADGDADDDIALLVQSMMKRPSGGPGTLGGGADDGRIATAGGPSSRGAAAAVAGPSATVEYLPTVADDYIRNFLLRCGMHRTLDAFNTEWFELRSRGKLPSDDPLAVPDLYAQNERLSATVTRLQLELGHAQELAARAQATWEKLRRERDFHRMHHKRVVQEKNRLIGDMKRLKTHFQTYEPTIRDLRTKYEAAVRERMLVKVERDKMAARLAAADAHGKVAEDAAVPAPPAVASAPPGRSAAAHSSTTGRAGGSKGATGRLGGATTRGAGGGGGGGGAGGVPDTKLPEESENPYLRATFTPARVTEFTHAHTVVAHGGPIASVAFHPTKPVAASVSDDSTWRLWALPEGELIMTGEGHRTWLADVDFHPSGTKLATSSGDGIIKLWDLTTASCIATYPEHTQATWSIAFHTGGDFLLSASMDHSCRLFDLHTSKVRQTLRGHVDSVNAVAWQPFTPIAVTGSGDKTVSLWDVRSGLSVQTFYGHTNAVNDVLFSATGDAVASCDSDGIVCYWDVRMAGERGVVELGRFPAHGLALDHAGSALAVACDDGVVRVVDVAAAGSSGSATAPAGLVGAGGRAPPTKLAVVATWKGHTDVVQAVAFDPSDRAVLSASNDATLRLWADPAGMGAATGR